MKYHFRLRRGFTLVETVVAVVLTTTMIVLVYEIVLLSLDLRRVELMAEGMQGESSEAVYRFSRDVRSIGNATSLVTATANDLRLVDSDNQTVRYWLSGSSLMRNSQVLAVGISSVVFSYYDANGVPIVSPLVSPAATDVRLVRMVLTVESQGQTLALRSEARFRSFE